MRRRWIPVLLAIVMLTAMLPVPVLAEEAVSGKCGDNLVWSLENGTLTIGAEEGTSGGSMNDYDSREAAPWYDSRASITAVTVEKGVTSIGSRAFFGCGGVSDMVLPDGLNSIGESAFAACSGLERVTLPEGIASVKTRTFESCKKLEQINLPDSLNELGDYAFRSCTALQSIRISDGVTVLAEGVFSGCSRLDSVVLPAGLTAIKQWAFSDCSSLTDIVLPDKLTAIEDGAFSSCGLESAALPASLSEISGMVFAGCKQLKGIEVSEGNEIFQSENGILYTGKGAARTLVCCPAGKTEAEFTIPSDVTGLSKGAFYSCEHLTSIDFPNGINVIGSSAFTGCSGLEAVDLSGCTGLTAIESSTFGFCKNLRQIELPAELTSIDSHAFYFSPSLESIVLPAALTSLGQEAFQNCTGLKSADLSACSGLTSISKFTFSNCEGLKEVKLPPELTVINQFAFNTCKSLETIYLPAGLTSIEDLAFGNCESLANVFMQGMKAPALPSAGNPFIWTADSLQFYIPNGAEGYGTGEWSAYAGKQQTYEPTTGIELDRTSLSLYSNAAPGSAVLTAAVTPAAASYQTVTWRSSAPEIAAVDENGTVTAVGNGNVVITATAFNGQTASCDVKVSRYSSGSGGSGSGSGRVSSHTITASAGEGGSISPSGRTAVKDGENQVYTIAPNAGFAISDVLVDSKSVGAVTSYTFEKVNREHTIAAKFTKKSENPFRDVSEGEWYFDAVRYSTEHSLFSGTSADTFSPDAPMTRGMLVTVLYHAAGEPDRSDEILADPFVDVDKDSWYGRAVCWAQKNDIASGVDKEHFAPDSSITREQLAVMLYRWAGKPAVPNLALTSNDAERLSGYADNAVRWAADQKLLSGKPGNLLDPQGNATRAEVAVVLQKYLSK